MYDIYIFYTDNDNVIERLRCSRLCVCERPNSAVPGHALWRVFEVAMGSSGASPHLEEVREGKMEDSGYKGEIEDGTFGLFLTCLSGGKRCV